MKQEKNRCPHCGAKMVEYRHTMNKGMVGALVRFYNHGWPANILKDFKLTHNQVNNFQKMAYFGLIKKHYDIDGKRVNGFWDMTDLGKDFVLGKKRIPKSVFTFRGNVSGRDIEEIHISEVDRTYKERDDYVKEQKTIPMILK